MKVAPAKPYRPRMDGAAIGCRNACAASAWPASAGRTSAPANCTGASSRTFDVDMVVIVCLCLLFVLLAGSAAGVPIRRRLADAG
jgi:hypothetical protein